MMEPPTSQKVRVPRVREGIVKIIQGLEPNTYRYEFQFYNLLAKLSHALVYL